jgi:3-phosphoshikimate 1-carboxyvinyltransferase
VLILAALAAGESVVSGLLEGDDVMHTAAALRCLGAEVERSNGLWRVHGRGVGGLREPAGILDFGNAGTGARLLMGALASHPFVSFFDGDESLRRRPMARVAAPVERMGAQIVARSGVRLPLAVIGTSSPVPIRYELPVASAQVKSAVLLAGLNAPGKTEVVEPMATRDHTERLLRYFGAEITVEETQGGGAVTVLTGQPELTAREVTVPGDPSSAAFLVVAALLCPDAEVTIEQVCVNPRRIGLYDTLREMGADITFANPRTVSGEDVADIVVRASALSGVDVPAERTPSMIDEYPILGVAAACASGTTQLRGLAELRVKESDRLAAMARGLQACGTAVQETEDGLTIEGAPAPPGGARITTDLDHRMAMAFLVLGTATQHPVEIDDGQTIATSFPGFAELLNGLGAHIEAAG